MGKGNTQPSPEVTLQPSVVTALPSLVETGAWQRGLHVKSKMQERVRGPRHCSWVMISFWDKW